MKENPKRSEQFARMTETPIPQLTISLAVPSVIGMLISTMYNMVDTWFVAQLGTIAVAACGISFPIMEFINSIGYLMGMGSGTLIGLLLGKRDLKKAGSLGSAAFFLTLGVGTLLAAAGLLFLNPLMRLLGASEAVLPSAAAYARYILIGIPVMSVSLVLSSILRCEGKNRCAMIGIASGGVLNMLLDPVFIFVLGQGVAGAAMATLISQTAGLFLLLSYYLRGQTETHLSIREARITAPEMKKLLITGLPSLCRHGTATLAGIALNLAAGVYGGDALIAALSIVSKVSSLIQSVIKGIFQGSQSIYSYNKGAERYDRVLQAYRFTLVFNTVLVACVAAVMPFMAKGIMGIFSVTDPDVLRLGILALILQAVSLLIMPFNMSVNQLLQSIGFPKTSTLLTILPQGLFYIPALAVLPLFLQANGVIAAPILGQALCAAVTWPILKKHTSEMRAKIRG